MMKFDRLAVIKTAWSDTYVGEDVEGNFGHLSEGGDGAERFNMRIIAGEYQVYALPKAEWTPPVPSPASGWTVVHVARDPAVGKIKIVGWYEDATFIGKYLKRDGEDGLDRSVYCITSPRARLVPPADRPVIDHERRFGSSGIFWLSGNEDWSGKSWDRVARRITKLVKVLEPAAIDPSVSDAGTLADDIGDTRRKDRKSTGVWIDDDGDVYGRNHSAESPEHEALRLWARDYPAPIIGDHALEDSRTEYPLPSGDRVDASHRSSTDLWLIEAKSRRSGEKDIERGIYQCVKYRAVAEAMQRIDKGNRTIHAILLTEKELSDRNQTLADRHRITVFVKDFA